MGTALAAPIVGVRPNLPRIKSPRPDPQALYALLRERGVEGLDSPDLVGLDLSGLDLRGLDLRGLDLRGADLYRASLDGADLRGARLDTARIVEIEIPTDLDLEIVNQIRHFDFKHSSHRVVAPVGDAAAASPCPYRGARLRPVLFDWGSRTWNGGSGWRPPLHGWTLEEIIAMVFDAIGCRHDLPRPHRGA